MRGVAAYGITRISKFKATIWNFECSGSDNIHPSTSCRSVAGDADIGFYTVEVSKAHPGPVTVIAPKTMHRSSIGDSGDSHRDRQQHYGKYQGSQSHMNLPSLNCFIKRQSILLSRITAYNLCSLQKIF